MKRTSAKAISSPLTIIRKNRRLALAALFFILGLVTGCMAAGAYDGENENALHIIIGGFAQLRRTDTLAQTFFSSLGANIPLLIVIFILGFCALGTPLISLAAAFKGIGLGTMLGYLYAYYGVKGILYSLLLIIPPALLSVPALLLSCSEAMRFSASTFCFLSKSASHSDELPDMKRYCLRFAVFSVIIIASALADCLFFLIFGKLISL